MTQIITINDAKDQVAVKNGYTSWLEFDNTGDGSANYFVIKSTMLDEVIALYSENQSTIRQELTKQIYDHKESKLRFASGYRALISEQIAQLKAVQMMNSMIQSNHTHRAKNSFANQFNTVLDSLISRMKDEAKSGLWKFGSDFQTDELPF